MLKDFKRPRNLFGFLFTGIMLIASTFLYAEDAKTMELDKAISSSSKEVISFFNQKEFKKYKANIAVVVSNTETDEMGEYLATQFEKELKKSKNIQLLARSKTAQAARKAEIDYQYSGFVSDEDMVVIGQEQGAKYVVSVSFQQIDKKNLLTVRTIDVASSEIKVGPQVYNITASKQLDQLLKNTRELNTLSEFLDEIEKWKLQKRKTEQQRDEEILNSQGAIRSEYEDKIAEANQKQYPKNKSDEYIKKDREERIRYLENERNKKLADAQKTVTERYAAAIENFESKKENVIEAMLAREFRLRGQEQIFITIGEFQRNAKPQYFPINFNSQDPNIQFNESYRILVKQDDDLDFNRIDEPREKGDYLGQLIFKLERIKGTDEFYVRVSKVSLIRKSTAAELFAETPMKRTNRVPIKYGNVGQTENDEVEKLNEDSSSTSALNAGSAREENKNSSAKESAKNIALAAAYDDEDYDLYYSGSESDSWGLFEDGFTIDGKKFDYTGEVLVKSSQLEKDLIFSKYEMTQELYEYLMGENPSEYQNISLVQNGVFWSSYSSYFSKEMYDVYSGGIKIGQVPYYEYNGKLNEDAPEYMPVENMTWFQCLAFCNELTKKVLNDSSEIVYFSDKKLTKPYTMNDARQKKAVFINKEALGWRLPTTDEWEVAAGRKVKTDFWTGKKTYYYDNKYSGGSDIGELAWYSGNSKNSYYDSNSKIIPKHQEVGRKKPNENGLYDMTGNVWEWCWSDCGEYSYSWSEFNVFIKGGCFYNDERQCRFDWVARQVPDCADKGIGFRICRNAPNQ